MILKALTSSSAVTVTSKLHVGVRTARGLTLTLAANLISPRSQGHGDRPDVCSNTLSDYHHGLLVVPSARSLLLKRTELAAACATADLSRRSRFGVASRRVPVAGIARSRLASVQDGDSDIVDWFVLRGPEERRFRGCHLKLEWCWFWSFNIDQCHHMISEKVPLCAPPSSKDYGSMSVGKTSSPLATTSDADMSMPDLQGARRIDPTWCRPADDVLQQYLLVPNSIRTTKYTLITFLPKNLFEQFHRVANLYFLLLVCLNWVPQLNVFGKEITMLPLLFVLSVTAIKDLFEDRRRYLSDKEVNNRKCNVFDG